MNEKYKITNELNGVKGCYVAGGAVTSIFTNQPINDFDVYPKSDEAFEDMVHWAYDSGWFCADASERAMTFVKAEQPNLQIMHFDRFETSQKIFDAFDFTCCMGALDMDSEEFEFHDDFMKHCAQRFISFNSGTRFPYASAWRVKKYTERGYTIGKMEFMKILMACQAKPLTSWAELRQQIGGVYGEAFIIPEGEEYSLEAALKAVSTLHFKADKHGYGSAEEAIIMTSNREIPVLEWKDKKYVRLSSDGHLTETKAMPKNPRTIGVSDLYPDGLFYKVVNKTDGRYTSIYQPKFEYQTEGETTSTEPHLWIVNKFGVKAKYASYAYNVSKGSERAILEVRVKPDDLIFSPIELKAKAVTVVRECPLSEFADLKDEELPF